MHGCTSPKDNGDIEHRNVNENIPSEAGMMV